MKKYFEIYKKFLKISFRSQLMYRTNFLTAVVVEFFWVLSHLVYVLAIWRAGVRFPGFGNEALLVFVGTYLILTGILMAFFYSNLSSIPRYIHEGLLDLYLVKPVSSQFFVSLQQIDFGYPLSDLSVGIVLLVIGWNRAGFLCSISTIGGYIWFLLMGVVWMYCFQMVPVLLSFLFVKSNGIFEVFYGLHDLNKVPMGIYGNAVQLIGTFIIPVFPMVNFPPMWALGTLDITLAVYGSLAPIVLFLIIRVLWKIALRKYTSANG